MQVGDTYSAFLLGGDQLPTCKFDYKKTSTIRTKTSGVYLNEDVIQPPSQGKAIRPPQRDRVRRSEVAEMYSPEAVDNENAASELSTPSSFATRSSGSLYYSKLFLITSVYIVMFLFKVYGTYDFVYPF